MSFTHKLTSRWSSGGRQLENAADYTGEAETNVNAPVADAASNAEIDFQLTIAQLVSFYMVADQDVTVFTNEVSGGDPAETIALIANVPFMQNAATADYWDGATEILATDITKLFVTATGGVATTLHIRYVYDSSP